MPAEVKASWRGARLRESNASVAAIVRRIAHGDHEALGELFDRYGGLVGGVAKRILRDHADAQDVVQTVFVQVWRQAGRYDGTRGSAEGWLCAIARTRALDCLRRQRSRREAPSELAPESRSAGPIVERLSVRRALAGLPSGQRLPLALAYYEGLTQPEIARRIGAPLGTIKSRMRTALIRLRESLGTLPENGGCIPSSARRVRRLRTCRSS